MDEKALVISEGNPPLSGKKEIRKAIAGSINVQIRAKIFIPNVADQGKKII